jgi:hypothetical protein
MAGTGKTEKFLVDFLSWPEALPTAGAITIRRIIDLNTIAFFIIWNR